MSSKRAQASDVAGMLRVFKTKIMKMDPFMSNGNSSNVQMFRNKQLPTFKLTFVDIDKREIGLKIGFGTHIERVIRIDSRRRCRRDGSR